MADATLTKHKDLRNAVVHGSPLHYEADGTVHFLMVQRRKRRLPTMVLRTVGPKQWDQLNRVSTQALGYLILVLFVLNPEEVRFHASNKITREVAVKLASRLPGSKALREFVAKVLAGET